MIRFLRRVRIAPGVRLNFTRSGVSASVGPRGAHLTAGHGAASLYAGVPGTGLSARTNLRAGPGDPPSRRTRWVIAVAWCAVFLLAGFLIVGAI
jgi:hypothetical protein